MNEFRLQALDSSNNLVGQTDWMLERTSSDAPNALATWRLQFGSGFTFKTERRAYTGNGAIGIGTPGVTGVSGFSGWSGYSGATGEQGVSGYSGAGASGGGGSGFSGYSGYSGASGAGVSGFSGYSGTSGWSGVGTEGQSGFSGLTGSSGFSGFSGGAGAGGASGFSGFSGTGSTGQSGFSGFSGQSGASGYSGFSGASGYSGFSGRSGYSGYSGNNGASGFSGFSGSGTGSTFASSPGGTTTSTSLVDLAGMSIPLTPGTWIFQIVINGNAATGTAGARFGVQYSGTSSSIEATQIGQLNTTAVAATARITALNTPSTICMTTSAAECQIYITGQIVVTGNGNLTARGLKVTSGTLTYRGSSWMMAFKVA